MSDKQRCRLAAQILIEQIGADGPQDVTEAARRAADEIDELRARIADLEDQLRDATKMMEPELRAAVEAWKAVSVAGSDAVYRYMAGCHYSVGSPTALAINLLRTAGKGGG